MSGGERGGGSVFKQGDAVFIPAVIQAEHEGRTAPIYSVLALGDVPAHRVLPASDALPAVARWIWEHGEEDFRHLIELAVYHLPDSEHGPYVGDAAYLRHLEKAGSELIVALMGGEGAGGG